MQVYKVVFSYKQNPPSNGSCPLWAAVEAHRTGWRKACPIQPRLCSETNFRLMAVAIFLRLVSNFVPSLKVRVTGVRLLKSP